MATLVATGVPSIMRQQTSAMALNRWSGLHCLLSQSYLQNVAVRMAGQAHSGSSFKFDGLARRGFFCVLQGANMDKYASTLAAKPCSRTLSTSPLHHSTTPQSVLYASTQLCTALTGQRRQLGVSYRVCCMCRWACAACNANSMVAVLETGVLLAHRMPLSAL